MCPVLCMAESNLLDPGDGPRISFHLCPQPGMLRSQTGPPAGKEIFATASESFVIGIRNWDLLHFELCYRRAWILSDVAPSRVVEELLGIRPDILVQSVDSRLEFLLVISGQLLANY